MYALLSKGILHRARFPYKKKNEASDKIYLHFRSENKPKKKPVEYVGKLYYWITSAVECMQRSRIASIERMLTRNNSAVCQETL